MRYFKIIILSLGCLIIYISFIIFFYKLNDRINVNYSNEPKGYITIYLDGELSYNGEIEVMKDSMLGDIVSIYLTEHSDLESYNPKEIVLSYKKYSVSYKEKVNINTSSKSELEHLPGIGNVYAEKIISNRPYTKIIELKERKVIGEALYDSIKNEICCQ